MELVKETTEDQLRRLCDEIRDELENPLKITAENVDEWEGDIGENVFMGEWVTLRVFDERYVINKMGDLIEVQVMVAGGGPTIWVSVSEDYYAVNGHWAEDRVTRDRYYQDGLGLWQYYVDVVDPFITYPTGG
jgi:hypothetical protein